MRRGVAGRLRSQRTAVVVLAAGASIRLGQPKQLVRYGGELLINRAIRVALEAGGDPVFVVLGANFEQTLEALTTDKPPVRVLVNQAWRTGMASSVALGAAAAERVGADQLILMACDQPAVSPAHLKRLIEISEGEHVVASAYAGRRGVPALFPDFAFHALEDLSGDWGARSLLQRAEVLTAPLPGGEFDIDTPADLNLLQQTKGTGTRRSVDLVA